MSRLWVDVTTTMEEQGRHPHGTTRVERGVIGAFLEQPGQECAFCAFDRATGCFIVLRRDVVSSILAAPVEPDRRRERAGRWRRRLWAVPSHLRRVLSAPPAIAGAPDDPFATGDMVLFCGEHSRHDFARLAALKRSKNLSLVFIMFDVLDVLENGDPRLDNPEAADLPQTDFMVREACLILPISRFSEMELRRHLARRGLSGPPVTPIRIGSALGATGEGTLVPGLEPGRFILCVGDVVERKNHALLVRLWRRVPTVLPLAIVGRIDMEGNALVDAVQTDPALCNRISFFPNLDDESLHWLYRNCRFTVFPSRLEGFGLPVAESLSYGRPCIASSAGAIPEAGQGCVISLDPDDEAAWAEALCYLIDDETLLTETERVACLFRPVRWGDTVGDIMAAIQRFLAEQ